MRKIAFFFVTILGIFPSIALAGNFSYPFEKIATPACKWNPWSTLGDDCKMDLPKITGANYAAYEKNTLYRRVYSVLWGATYDYGWDLWLGSHLWVDIATAAGTPVLSIGEGVVVFASWSNGWGNVVTVQHTLSDKTVLYSNYAHLSKISVKNGDTVHVRQKVGEVGNTGNSYGNHLHFQIDITNQSHPYYYVSCGKGIDPLSVVNKGLCRDFLTANTIDPIAFLESGKISVPGGPDATVITAIKNRPQEKTDRTNMKSRAEIQQEEIDEFLKRNSLSFGFANGGTNLQVGQSIQTVISSGDNRWKSTTGNLPELGLEFVFDRSGISVFPERIVALDGGKRAITVRGLKSGSYEIVFKMGKTIVATRTVFVFSPTETKQPSMGEIKAPKTLLLGEDKNVVVTMKTKYGTPQLDTPYEGKYRISVLNGKAKFCNASKPQSTSCRTENLSDELIFSYNDTYRGALQLKIRAYSFAPIALTLTRIDTKKPVSMARTKTDTVVGNPRWLDKTHPYYAEIISALEKGAFPLKDGYILQDRELVWGQMKELIRRSLGYAFLKAGNDFSRKKMLSEKISTLEREWKNQSDFQKISRGQLAEILLRIKGDSLLINGSGGFTDETGSYKNAITTLRVRYAFKWKDSFGERYFQSDKIVTVGEALYLSEKIGL